MRARLELERFGALPAGRPDGPAQAPASSHAAGLAATASRTAAGIATGRIAGPAPGLAAEPACPPDPDAERITALGRIAAAVERIGTDQGALRQRSIAAVAATLGATAESLLPRLARHGFAGLVAEATAEIARRGRWPELVLSVSAADADAVTGALGAPAAGAVPVRVVPDAALGPGEARLGWNEGGADIDIPAIAAAAHEQFRLRLAALPKEHGA